MKAYMIVSDKNIDPFNDHPQDCLIGNSTLGEIQRSVLGNLGIQLVKVSGPEEINDTNEHILFTDNLFFSKELLTEFITRSKGTKQKTVCALKRGTFTLRTVIATQDVKIGDDTVEYKLYYFPGSNLSGETIPLVIEPDQIQQTMPMPEHMSGLPVYEIPLTEKMAIHIDNWTNLWAANIASILLELARIIKGSKLKLLTLAVKARSANQWKILKHTNNIGHNCDIHPKAYIEGSTIGDNVIVGAGTVIRECNVAPNVYIESNVTINSSVVGEKSYIADGSVIRFSAINPGSFIFSIVSCSLLGRDTFVGAGAIITDFRLDRKPIIVFKDGLQVNTENAYIGSCLGHGVYLASGCTVNPGRTVPNGLHVTPEESRVIRKFGPDGGVEGYRTIKFDK